MNNLLCYIFNIAYIIMKSNKKGYYVAPLFKYQSQLIEKYFNLLSCVSDKSIQLELISHVLCQEFIVTFD